MRKVSDGDLVVAGEGNGRGLNPDIRDGEGRSAPDITVCVLDWSGYLSPDHSEASDLITILTPAGRVFDMFPDQVEEIVGRA